VSVLIVKPPGHGPRLYVGGLRVHHGASGSLLAAAALLGKRKRTALLGLALCIHDLHDLGVWFRVERLP
jgi:hypothetical protein